MAILQELTDAVKDIVAAIEAQPALTQHRYDQYMTAITRIATGLGNGTNARTIAVVVLVQAGANKEGVLAAFRALS